MFPMKIGIALKTLRKVYLANINFTINWVIVQLVIKIMNMYLALRKLLKKNHHYHYNENNYYNN